MLPQSWQVFMTCCVTKAMPIYFINGKCHIKQLKSVKSHKNGLYHAIPHHWIIMHLEADTTHRHTNGHMNQSNFKKTGTCQPHRLACAWIKNVKFVATTMPQTFVHNNIIIVVISKYTFYYLYKSHYGIQFYKIEVTSYNLSLLC